MEANEATLSRTDAQPKDVHAALTALARDLSPLSDPSPRLRRYATAFIDALLDAGQPAAAQKAAAKAVQAGRDLAAPPSLGRDQLRGAAGLDCSSMPHRELLDDVLALLGRLAAVDRRVVPRLFEAVKRWAGAERRVALANLLAVDLRAEDRAAGLAEVLRFAARFDKEDRARRILRELTGACATDGAWMLALLAAVERAPSTGERLLSALDGSEFGEPLLARFMPTRVTPTRHALRRVACLAAGLSVFACSTPAPEPGGPPTRARAAASPTPAPFARPLPAEPEPAPLPAPPEAATPPPAEPAPAWIDALARCGDDTQAKDTRRLACREVLDHPGLQDSADPNLAAERAEAIQHLHALGPTSPVHKDVRKALGARRTCVTVHEEPATGIVSLMCRAAMCGMKARWLPFEVSLATGALRAQQC